MNLSKCYLTFYRMSCQLAELSLSALANVSLEPVKV
jgi:hypothetical protein